MDADHGNEQYDVAIIGGGITGVGVARDCAIRGLKTLLVERNDFGSGTTGTCMGMLHGGARYLLEEQEEITEVSCRESGKIQNIAPHLCFRIPFIRPVFPGDKYPLNLVDMFFEEYDQYQTMKNGNAHIKLQRDEALKLEPALNPAIDGGIVFEEWGVDVFRLTLLNALDARAHGATVRNHCEVTDLIVEDGRVNGIEVYDARRQQRERYRAKYTVNAAGPWSPAVASLIDANVRQRPTKGIHLFFDRRITSIGVVAHAVDGREVELLPHETTTMLGCTDDDYFGDIDHVRVNPEEVEYLLSSMEEVLPRLRENRLIRTMVGVRPLLYEPNKRENEVSRDFAVIDHEKEDDIPGLFTLTGGKMVVYRLMAERLVDTLLNRLGRDVPCTTAEVPLPGCTAVLEEKVAALAARYGVSRFVAQRLVYRHGTLAEDVLARADNARRRSRICQCEGVIAAELEYAVDEELALTLDDLRRRTRMGMGPCQGNFCIDKAARLLANAHHADYGATLELSLDFIDERWKGKAPILLYGQLAQEELTQGYYDALGNLAPTARIVAQHAPDRYCRHGTVTDEHESGHLDGQGGL